MISDLDGSLGSRHFPNIANERTCFASCECAFKSFGLITCLECSSDYAPVIFDQSCDQNRKTLTQNLKI